MKKQKQLPPVVYFLSEGGKEKPFSEPPTRVTEEMCITNLAIVPLGIFRKLFQNLLIYASANTGILA